MGSLSLATPPDTLPPLLRLASELHLAIISFLPDLKDAKDEDDLMSIQACRDARCNGTLFLPDPCVVPSVLKYKQVQHASTL
jgi:hypothetical protein